MCQVLHWVLCPLSPHLAVSVTVQSRKEGHCECYGMRGSFRGELGPAHELLRKHLCSFLHNSVSSDLMLVACLLHNCAMSGKGSWRARGVHLPVSWSTGSDRQFRAHSEIWEPKCIWPPKVDCKGRFLERTVGSYSLCVVAASVGLQPSIWEWACGWFWWAQPAVEVTS